MTVCIGAVAEKNTLIGISDRMLTAADGQIEFETGQVKAWQFTSSIVALVSGDLSIQGGILHQLDTEVKAWISNDPDKWVKVKDVATLYCTKLRELRRKWAEETILYPLGLDIPSFLTAQSSMHSDVVADIKERLIEYEFANLLETIFMGIDTDGPLGPKGEAFRYPQLYVTAYDRLSWLTTIGFAAIGIGKSHAESQFMFSGHWPLKPFDETLLLAYTAKKRAEAAPGVGKETDIVVIGPDLGSILHVERHHVKGLEDIYQRSSKANARAVEAAQKSTKIFVEDARKYYEEKRRQENVPPNPPEPKVLSEGKEKAATS